MKILDKVLIKNEIKYSRDKYLRNLSFLEYKLKKIIFILNKLN